MPIRQNTLFNFGQVRKGSIDGVPFFILKDGENSEGRKTVVHEYPNSNRRYVEDQGQSKGTYSLDLYVNYNAGVTNRDNLLNALRKDGVKRLVHPFIGQKDVKIGIFSYSHQYGIVKFNVTFIETNKNVLPLEDRGNKRLIDTLKDTLRGKQGTALNNTWNAVGKGIKTYNKAKEKATNALDQINEVSSAIFNVTSALGTVQNDIGNALDNIAVLIKTPSDLSARFTTIFNNFDNIGERAKDTFDAAKGLFGFGSDDIDTKTNTVNQRNIKANNDSINNLVRVNGLAIAYNNAVNLNYGNEEELDEIRGILESEYEDLVQDVDDDTANSLYDIRSQAEIVFNQINQNVPKIFEVNILTERNIQDIVYDYYGNFANSSDFSEKVTEIINLNSFTNPSKIKGIIRLLTNE